jgi:glycosyltransferase involved in cell wall biosynthesis
MAGIKVLIYSDCYIYGGSERLMVFLLQNKKIAEKFDLVFAYRKHKDYTKGLLNDFKKFKINITPHPLSALSNETIYYKINCSKLPSIIKKIIKVPFFAMQICGIYFIWNVTLFFFFIKKIKPLIVHINNGGYPGALACNHFVFAAKQNNINSIVYQVNNIAYKPRNFFYSVYNSLINKWVKYFITASIKAGNALNGNARFSKEKIVQIPNVTPPEKITTTKDNITKELQWQSDSFLIVQVAFLTERKGQLYLIKAVESIRKKCITDLSNKIRLILIGDGEDEPALRKYVNENGIDDIVFFAGYRSDAANYIKACDTFILPSIANEDMPLSLLTAMSLAKPVIATNFAGIAEAIKDNESGLLLNADPETLTENLLKSIKVLYNDPGLRDNLGKNARTAFNKNYSEDKYAQKITQLYNSSLMQG